MSSLLRTGDAARLAGITPAAWCQAVTRSRLLREARVSLDGRTPAWPREVVEEWLRTRPGRGARTDLRGGTPERDLHIWREAKEEE